MNKRNYIKELLLKVDSKEYSAFKEFFDLYYNSVMQVALLFCTNEDAEEVTNDVFLQIWDRDIQLHTKNNLNNFLFVITKNKCLNVLRKKKINVTNIETILNDYQTLATPFEDLIFREIEEKINQAIENLPPKCKEAYMLVKVDGLKTREAAQKLSISEKTVEKHTRNAKKALWATLKRYQYNWY